MYSIGISQPNQLSEILERARTAHHEGHEFSSAILPFSAGQFGVELTADVELFVTDKELIPVEGGPTVTKHSIEPKAVPEEAIGQIATGNLLYVQNGEIEAGWPKADICLQVIPSGIERPGLVVGIGISMLSEIYFVPKTAPTFDAYAFVGRNQTTQAIVETKPL